MVLGWDQSAEAWLTVMGSTGDFSRFGVLDAPMLKRVVSSGAQTVLDVGCGEGRFCRIMSEHVPLVTGLDPTRKLLDQARLLGGATYVEGHAEALPFDDGSFHCVVSYLSLIDIADAKRALSEMSRVLKPGGRLMVLEFSQIPNDMLQRMYDTYSFNVIPQMGRMITGDRDSYQYLVESIRKFPRPPEFQTMIRKAGFVNTKAEIILGGAVAIHSGWKI